MDWFGKVIEEQEKSRRLEIHGVFISLNNKINFIKMKNGEFNNIKLKC